MVDEQKHVTLNELLSFSELRCAYNCKTPFMKNAIKAADQLHLDTVITLNLDLTLVKWSATVFWPAC